MSILELDGRKLFMSGHLLMRLNPHEAAILKLLNDNPLAVSRKDLLATGWPHTIVSENSINMAIKSIRSSTGLKNIITTEQGIGYSFNHEDYRINLVSNSFKDNADIPQSSQLPMVSPVETITKVKSKKFNTPDIVSFFFSITIGLFFYFSSEKVYCEKFEKIQICSVEKKELTLAKSLITTQSKNEDRVYYYGRLNGYKEYNVVEIK